MSGVYREAIVCRRCELEKTRHRVVFGAGSSTASLMFVGEAPGAREDRLGAPFVGRSGALLDQMLDEIGRQRGDVFIANALKCRPPANRNPTRPELAACRPWLDAQVRLIRPRVIATLGNFATRLLTGSDAAISTVRGRPQQHTLGGHRVWIFPLYHPAAVLRNRALMTTMRTDFLALRALVEGAGLPR